MWKLSFVLLLVTSAVLTQDLTQQPIVPVSLPKNSTQQHEQADKSANISEISKIQNTGNSTKTKENEGKFNKSTETSSLDTNEQFPVPQGDLDDFNFKYYWFLLVGSSLAIIGIITFKTFRLRRNRAEVRYGKPSDSEEIEPFSKWGEESSSENEDEIFDINFLKNTRLQTHNDNL